MFKNKILVPINVTRKQLNNVLKRMEKIEGPLKMLQTYVMARTRVKVNIVINFRYHFLKKLA